MKMDARIRVLVRKVKGKRPRTVLEHVLKYGQVTTRELRDRYGYNHPPRAARDVREQGIPLETVRIRDEDGRMIAAYKLGDLGKVERHKLAGRKVFSKRLKYILLKQQGAKCAITGEQFEPRYLSIDHRIPYEVAGDIVSPESDPDGFMLVSASAQRQKSWSCEHCRNWREIKDVSICRKCYWASPENYGHVAMEGRRRVVLVWTGDEVEEFEFLKARADAEAKDLATFIKDRLRAITSGN